jgi:hypothetical protein
VLPDADARVDGAEVDLDGCLVGPSPLPAISPRGAEKDVGKCLTDDRRRRLGFCGRKRIGGGRERARRGDGGDEAVPRSPRGAGAEAIPGGGADLQARARGRAAGPDAGSC